MEMLDVIRRRMPTGGCLGDAFKMRWDMIIAFPPCTDLAASGARYFAQKIADGRQQRSVDFL